MIWRPCRRDIGVGPDLFESLSNKLSIKSSWISIALRMTELWPSQWFTIGLPTNQKFNFTFVPTIKDWHVQVEPSELYQKSLCKYRNELTLYLTIMVVSIGFMSSSSSPSWQQTVLGLSLVGGQVVGSNQYRSPSWKLTYFFKTKLGDVDKIWLLLLQPSTWTNSFTTKVDFRFEHK